MSEPTKVLSVWVLIHQVWSHVLKTLFSIEFHGNGKRKRTVDGKILSGERKWEGGRKKIPLDPV